MRRIACYVSGHGFGHAVRVIEVLNALWQRRPDLVVAIRTPVVRWIFDFNCRGPFTYARRRLDVGAVQDHSLSTDPAATLRACARLARRKEMVIASEVAALGRLRPGLVLADIPALAFDVAARLGVPGVAMGNFSWDWIYADYARDFPAYAWLVQDLRDSYARASLLLRLPLHGDLSTFPRIHDIPLVARKASQPRPLVRRRLRLPESDPLVLLSFGGLGARLRTLPSAPPGVTLIASETATGGALSNLPSRVVSHREMAAADVRYEDLVAACDAVMSKPGYGIVADCIANGTPLVYTSRGRFAEYPHLVAGIRAHLPHAFISNEDLYAGRWTAALETVLAQPRRPPAVDTGGAAAAADLLLELQQT